mgnify:CR=1 FL=1
MYLLSPQLCRHGWLTALLSGQVFLQVLRGVLCCCLCVSDCLSIGLVNVWSFWLLG